MRSPGNQPVPGKSQQSQQGQHHDPPAQYKPPPAKSQPPPVKSQPPPAKSQPPPTTSQQGKNPPQQGKNQPQHDQHQPGSGKKRETSLDPDDLLYLVNLLKRASIDADFDADGDVSIALPHPRRQTTPAGTRSYQISDIVFDEIPQGQGEASSDTGEDGPGSKRGLVARFSLKDIIKTFFPLK